MEAIRADVDITNAVLLCATPCELKKRGVDIFAHDFYPFFDEFESLVAKERPGLAGCEVWYVGYDPKLAMCRIGVQHESLPLIRRGDTIMDQFLVKN